MGLGQEQVQLLGVPVDLDETAHALVDELVRWHQPGGSPRRMYYATAHALNLAQVDRGFREALSRADKVICEGWGVRLGARVAGLARPTVVQTMDWMDDYLAALAAERRSLYLLGDEPGVAQRCRDEMERRHPGLRVVGVRHGFFDVAGPANREVLGAIRVASPDVLFVGMGNPRQELWIDAHADELDVPVTLSLGAMFRWYAGIEKRAPEWMLRLRLWWLHRLLRHPIRHFRRYAIGNPLFLWRCLRQRWRR